MFSCFLFRVQGQWERSCILNSVHIQYIFSAGNVVRKVIYIKSVISITLVPEKIGNNKKKPTMLTAFFAGKVELRLFFQTALSPLRRLFRSRLAQSVESCQLSLEIITCKLWCMSRSRRKLWYLLLRRDIWVPEYKKGPSPIFGQIELYMGNCCLYMGPSCVWRINLNSPRKCLKWVIEI